MPALLKFLLRPRAAAGDLKEHPRWLAAFLVLALLSVLSQVLLESRETQAALDRIPLTAGAADKAAVEAMLRHGMISRMAFLPVRLFAGWALFALALYYSSRFFMPPGLFRIKHILALEIHAEAVPLAERLLTGILAAGGGGNRHFLSGVPLSLADVVPASSYPGNALLNAVSPFQLVYVALLAVGISEITGLRLWKAGAVSAAVWCLSVVANAALIAVLNDSLHLSF